MVGLDAEPFADLPAVISISQKADGLEALCGHAAGGCFSLAQAAQQLPAHHLLLQRLDGLAMRKLRRIGGYLRTPASGILQCAIQLVANDDVGIG